MSARTYHVEVAGLVRELPIIRVASGAHIAVFNILGDIEMTKAAGRALASRLRPLGPDVIVTTETKSVPLAYEIASLLSVPYVVFRKSYLSYIVDDVISTGSTLSAMRDLMARAGAGIVAEAAVFTEGDAERWKDIFALGHLPILEPRTV